jgi:hypothetical protein
VAEAMTVRWIKAARHPAIREGCRFGVAFGVLHVGNALLVNLANLDAAGNALLGNFMAVALVVSFGLVGWRGARATGRVRTGVEASLVTWVVSSAIGITALWIITFAFMDTIRHNTLVLQDFADSGLQDVDAFIVQDALGATLFGSAAMLALGTACGVLGAFIGIWSGHLEART